MAFIFFCLASAMGMKKDHIAEDFASDFTVQDVSFMQVSLELAATQTAVNVKHGAGEAQNFSKPTTEAWPSNNTAEETVAEAVAEASTAAKIAQDYATAISKSWKDASWPAHLVSLQEDTDHPHPARVVRNASKESLAQVKADLASIVSFCNRYVVLRVGFMLAACLTALYVLGLASQAHASKHQKVPGQSKLKPVLDNPSSGPNLYEPSRFHEDRDKRRVIQGGE